MFTRNGDKAGVEDEESCFGGLGDHRVRHEKVHLFIFFQVILVIQIPNIIIVKMACMEHPLQQGIRNFRKVVFSGTPCIVQSLDIEHCGEEIHLWCVFPI